MSSWIELPTLGGKSVIFRDLSRIIPLDDGSCSVCGWDGEYWDIKLSANEVIRRIEEAEAPASPRPMTITQEQYKQFQHALRYSGGTWDDAFKKGIVILGLKVEGEGE